MNPRLRPLAYQLSLLFASLPALAQEQVLDQVVVTAARAPMLLEHATGEITVVGSKEIEAKNPTKVTDILNTVPGVFVSTGKGMQQTTPGFALRGIPSDRRTLVMLDGIPLNDGYSGSQLLSAIPVDSISQAEVLFGPMSSLYGGNALGGVVNFVTRMPQKTEFGITVGYGNAFESGKAPADVQKTYIHAGTKFSNDLSVRFSGNWASTNGYRSDWLTGSKPANTAGAIPTTSETGSSTFLLGTKGDNAWWEHGASLKVEQKVGDNSRWSAGWMLQEYNYDYGDQVTYLRKTTAPVGSPVYTVASGEGKDGKYSRQIAHAGFETDLGIGRLNLLASYTDVGVNSSIITTSTSGTAFAAPGRINNSPSTSAAVDAYWVAALGNHLLTLGSAYRQDKADSRDYALANWANDASKGALYSQAAGTTTLWAGYLQDNWQIMPDLMVQGSARYDYWRNTDGHGLDPTGAKTYAERSDSAWSPKAGLAYKLNDALTLRSSIGSAFKAPTVYDLYRSSTLSSYDTKANPNLKPETVQTWEAGADWKPWRGGEIRATYFYNEISDLIYLGPKVFNASTGRNERYRINAGKAETSGVTLSLTHNFDPYNRIFANFTYTNSEMKENEASPTSVGKKLTFLPERQASLGFERRHGGWLVSMAGRYASKQYSDDTNADTAVDVYKAYDQYFVVDAKVSYRFNANLSASLAIDNLLNREYFSYYQAPQRSWFASLKYDY